jgi:Flp pilus assembly pilin Flp
MFDWISFKVGQAYLALRREDGQGATEYAMVIGVLVVLLGVSLGVLGLGITGFLDRVASKLDALIPAAA